jgi:hypothetical protein
LKLNVTEFGAVSSWQYTEMEDSTRAISPARSVMSVSSVSEVIDLFSAGLVIAYSLTICINAEI